MANASALRAALVGFFFAFWEHVLKTRGGVTLLLLDDPQDLLDVENRQRFAEALPQLVKAGAQLLVTSHDREFARNAVTVMRRERKSDVEHRSIFPVNDASPTVQTPLAVDDLERKRQDFLRKENCDQPSFAQEYITELDPLSRQALQSCSANRLSPRHPLSRLSAIF